MKSIRGKTVVITGAGSGIGRALALRCAREGARVAICDVSEAGLKETAAAVGGAGAEVLALAVDVSKKDQLAAFAERARAALGPADVLVNNAGVSLSETIQHMRLEDFEWLMNINFWGVVHGTSAFLPQLLERPEAHIVNLSSVFGLIAVPSQAAYNASKFAVRGYTEALRLELASTRVGVTSVHPGGVKTNIVRSGRHYRDALGAAIEPEDMCAQFDAVARTTPEVAADAIVRGILKNQPRVLIGADARLADLVQRLLPASYGGLLRFFLARAPRPAPTRAERSSASEELTPPRRPTRAA